MRITASRFEDNSAELREWLMSFGGTTWSQGEHMPVRHHALLELHDDVLCDSDGADEWDNSMFNRRAPKGPTAEFRDICSI